MVLQCGWIGLRL